MNLFELTAQRLELQHKLEAMDLDEVTIQDTLEGNAQELEEKIQDYGYILRNRRGLSDAMEDEIARMQERYTVYKKHTIKIEDWLQKNMEACKLTSKIDFPAFSVQLKKNPSSVIIDDETLIPAEYMKMPEPKIILPVPDKNALKLILKVHAISGCHLEQKNRLVIS